jgi:hypothetical protein
MTEIWLSLFVLNWFLDGNLLPSSLHSVGSWSSWSPDGRGLKVIDVLGQALGPTLAPHGAVLNPLSPSAVS